MDDELEAAGQGSVYFANRIVGQRVGSVKRERLARSAKKIIAGGRGSGGIIRTGFDVEYLVEWYGFPGEDTWEPACNVTEDSRNAVKGWDSQQQ